MNPKREPLGRATAPPYTVVLDPAAYAGITLLESDGVPMETIWHRDCAWLLLLVVTHHCRDRNDFFRGSNNFLYFNPDQARNLDYRGPDFFYVRHDSENRWAVTCRIPLTAGNKSDFGSGYTSSYTTGNPTFDPPAPPSWVLLPWSWSPL